MCQTIQSTSHKTWVATDHINAILLLSDGDFFLGKGIGVHGQVEGEICFNTGMTGYQETLTDPSYEGQIITFTFPHVGNVGTNEADNESKRIFCSGLVVREPITAPSNFRSEMGLSAWLESRRVTGISGIDTRELTLNIRDKGPRHTLIFYAEPGTVIDISALYQKIKDTPTLIGQELTRAVSTDKIYHWGNGNKYHVVVVDYGVKYNILNCLADVGLKLSIVPSTASYEDIMALNPDGVFLSNGPGDPFATAEFAVPVIKQLLDKKVPIFGICLGNQLLSLAAGLSTVQMRKGHRGYNQPVQDLTTKQVYITSQNHGFCVSKDRVPDNIEISHLSLFDHTVEGIRFKDRPAYSVQFHPESSPGPHETRHLFQEFVTLIAQHTSMLVS